MVRERIIQRAKELFLKFNYSRVTVDEISNDLGISKKTLYKYFPSKEKLLFQVLNLMFKSIEEEVHEIVDNKDREYIDRLTDIMAFMGDKTALFQSPLVKEIQRRFPDLWSEINRFRKDKIRIYMGKLLQEGVWKGVFREDTNIDLLIHVYYNLALASINPEFLAEHAITATQVFDEIISILFEGVLTPEGREHIQQIRAGITKKYNLKKEQ